VLKKAKDLKVPKDIIDRAIKKAEEAKVLLARLPAPRVRVIAPSAHDPCANARLSACVRASDARPRCVSRACTTLTGRGDAGRRHGRL